MPTFYRIVETDPPTESDFASYAAQGRPLYRDTPAMRRSWERVSVYTTLAAARETATRYPQIGRFIAVMEIDDDGPIAYEQSGRDRDHYDLHGEPSAMLRTVTRVVPV